MSAMLSPSGATTSSRHRETPMIRVVAFSLGGYDFAMPVTAILQVVPSPALPQGDSSGLGMAMWEDRPLLLLDLGAAFETSAIASGESAYMLLTRSAAGDRCGILLPDLPKLLDLPRDRIQSLPDAYRKGALGIARFVATWRSPTGDRTVYLLDLERAIAAVKGKQ